jgi:hypothetical protein
MGEEINVKQSFVIICMLFTFVNGAYALPKCVGSWSSAWDNCFGTYTYASGSKWVGAWENDNLNGYAITYYADGSINQEGIFKDDKFVE